MKILFKDFNATIAYDSNDSVLLVIENKEYFYRFVMGIQNQLPDQDFMGVVDYNYKPLKQSDYCDVVASVFDIDVNNKKNINSLFKLVKNECRDELKEFNDVFANLLSDLSKKIVLSLPISIDSDVNLSDDDIIKSMNFSICENRDSILSILVDYVKITHELRGIKAFIFVSLSAFMSEKDLNSFLYECKMMDVIVISIEQCNETSKSYAKSYVLDNDLCDY